MTSIEASDADRFARAADALADELAATKTVLPVFVGPTASGKSDLALELAARIDGEIVNTDSVQIYRHFDLGTGKPSASERARIPHHLLDAWEPLETVDASAFAQAADLAIAGIRTRGKVPILCGGSFLWTRAVISGLAGAPPADPELRASYLEVERTRGREALHEELKRVDPESAARLHPRDFVRVTRALEVFAQSGKTLSAFQAEHGFRDARYEALLVGVARDEPELTARIRKRVTGWLEASWIAAVESLVARGYEHARPMQSVGFREILAHLRGEIRSEELPEKIVRSTRIFARRQRTWLKQQPVRWL